MPCDFIKVALYQEHFQKNIETCFGTDIQQKTTRLFIPLVSFYALPFWNMITCHNNYIKQPDGGYLF